MRTLVLVAGLLMIAPAAAAYPMEEVTGEGTPIREGFQGMTHEAKRLRDDPTGYPEYVAVGGGAERLAMAAGTASCWTVDWASGTEIAGSTASDACGDYDPGKAEYQRKFSPQRLFSDVVDWVISLIL